MERNVQTVHKQEENLCVYCGQMFPTLKGFNSHLRVDLFLPTDSVSRVKRSHLPEKSALMVLLKHSPFEIRGRF